ncbi:MAG: hypothetical protein QG635_2363 [Bacteroidota bacterium]|nr:hypothetical protein [Bacteroidota bacterium]
MYKIFLLLIISLPLFFLSCHEPVEQVIEENTCFSPQIGDTLVYEITDPWGNKIFEKDAVKGTLEKLNNGKSVSAFELTNIMNGLESHSWYLYKDENSLWFSSDSDFRPIIDGSVTYLKGVWLNIPFCNGSSFESVNNYNTENFTAVIDGKLVNGKFMHYFRLRGQYLLTRDFPFKSETVKVRQFNCQFDSWEEIIEPSDLVFGDGKKIRNQNQKLFTVFFSEKYGFLQFEQEHYVKKLTDFIR